VSILPKNGFCFLPIDTVTLRLFVKVMFHHMITLLFRYHLQLQII